MSDKYTLDDLKDVVRRLTADDGCPWDRIQTHDTLKRYLIEECYEVIDAIDNEDNENMCEELGDVLFQIVFHSELADKENAFDMSDVIDGVTRKMISRHPHIFSDQGEKSISEINESWESIKKEEKGYKNNMEILRSVPASLPALMRCEKVVTKAYKNNMDNESLEDIALRIEEKSKLIKNLGSYQKEEQEEIIGNFLLDLTKISHFSRLKEEFSLTNAVKTYINRFEDIETARTAAGEIDEDTDLEDVKANKIKKEEIQ